MTTHFYLRPPIEEMAFQLYGRPLHPELFEILAVRRIRRSGYFLDLWITTTGHVITWKDGTDELTEIVAGREDLPEWGQLLRHQLRGERCDMVGGTHGVSYQVSFQVETLTPETFFKVHRELLAEGGKGGLLHAATPNHRWALTPVSSIHVEAWGGGLSLSAFHTFPDECSIVKTQSLIEHN